MSWLVYKRGRIEPYRAYLPLFAVTKFLRHDCGALQPRTLYINENNKLYWSWEEETFNLFGKKLIKYFDNPRRLKQHFIKMDKAAALAIRSSQKIFRADLVKLNDQELIKQHQQLLSDSALAHFIFNTEIDVVDIFLEDFIKRQVARELKPAVRHGSLDEIFSALIKPISFTYVNKLEIAINRLAFKKDFSLQSAQHVYEQFWWTNLGFENMQPYSLEHFQKLIKKKAESKNLKVQLAHTDDFIKNNRQERAQFLKKFNFSPAIRSLLEICDQYIFYHDKRKELQVRTTYSNRLFLQEIARRRHLKIYDLEWLWPNEIDDVLRGKPVDLAEIANRKKCVACLAGYKSFQSWSGLAAKKIKDRAVRENTDRVKELHGRGVVGGLIRGRAKVCAGAAEALAKIKKGDILVCPMTLPDYLPAMKKAKAIITEEGGVTCHAAIIAREFKIPCIVGTKIATQVLRDGDLVEVDPKQGIVRVLS
jgi:phosphohistidine swiveling domain-containing protein